jgi:hypothetical protein
LKKNAGHPVHWHFRQELLGKLLPDTPTWQLGFSCELFYLKGALIFLAAQRARRPS